MCWEEGSNCEDMSKGGMGRSSWNRSYSINLGRFEKTKAEIGVEKKSKSREKRFPENHLLTMLSRVSSGSCCHVRGFKTSKRPIQIISL